MKKRIFICLVLTVVLLSCATTGTGSRAVPLDAAIEATAMEMSAAFPEGARLVVVSFDSPSTELSNYIMEELTGRLVMGRKLVMVDRKNYEYIQKELSFQESNASDETGQSIGRMMGAQSIIIGSLVKTGEAYRYRVTALGVESGVNEAAVLQDILNDKKFAAFLAALESGETGADVSYREAETARVPRTAADFLNRGLIFALRGDFDTALEDFDEAITRDPEMALAYLQRGKTLFARQADITSISSDFGLGWNYRLRNKTHNDDLALADFTRAIRINPSLGAAYLYRAVLYNYIQEHDKAIADFTQAIRINPDYSDGYLNRGSAYHAKGDYERAIADYTQALRINPNDVSAYYNRGHAYANKGDYERAIADYTQVLRINPNDVSAYYNRGNAYVNKDDYERAIADYTQVLRINPNDVAAYGNRGNAYVNKDDYERAIADYTQAIKIDPNAANAYGTRGFAYSRKGQKAEAIKDLEQAIKLNPNFQWAKDRLREIRGW